MRHEEAKARYEDAITRHRLRMREWRALAEPFLTAAPPFPEDSVLAAEAARHRLEESSDDLTKAFKALAQIALDEGVDPTTLF